jgi:16S rRNA (cytidine1402-2'-O)-methyltransferase
LGSRSGRARRGPEQGSDGARPSKLAPALYIVATPIGNAGDMTLRGLEVLAGADVVACEDTRRTAKLLAIHHIKARLASYHDHNAARAGPRLLTRIGAGESVALVSDAGTPLISDPGYRLAAAAIAAGHDVVPIPGPSAVLAALSVAGLPTDRFLFAGFLPSRASARRRALGELASIPATLVVMESARRLVATLADMAAAFGPRPAAIARELTKLHEEVRRDTLSSLATAIAEERAESGHPPLGEVTIVIGPPPRETIHSDIETNASDQLLGAALATMRPGPAAVAVAEATGLPRKSLYARAVALKRGGAG